MLSSPVAPCHFLVNDSADNHLLINPPARQRRFLVASYHLAVTLIFPVVAIFAAVIYPTANFCTCPFTVSGVQLSVERGGQTFTRPNVVRAETGDPHFLRPGQWNMDIFIDPRQRFIPLDGVVMVALALCQSLTFHNGFTIDTGHATAY